MNYEALREGMIVKSMAGHDSGGWYVVMKKENGFAFIANGKDRKIENPKKKNPLHLQKTLSDVDIAELTNKKLIVALKSFDGANTAEESE